MFSIGKCATSCSALWHYLLGRSFATIHFVKSYNDRRGLNFPLIDRIFVACKRSQYSDTDEEVFRKHPRYRCLVCPVSRICIMKRIARQYYLILVKKIPDLSQFQ